MLSSEVEIEVKRKSIHALITGTLAPLIILGTSNVRLARVLGMGLYGVFLCLFVLFEFSLRSGRNWNIPFASAAYKIMANEHELRNKTMLGGVFICLSGLIVVSFLNLSSALIGIMVLSYADSAASIAGKGRPNHAISYNKGKHWEGTAAFVVVAFVVTAFVLAFVTTSVLNLIGISLSIAFASAFVESLPVKYYYDNLTIPLCAALLAQLLMST
jgi:dolichol kinase